MKNREIKKWLGKLVAFTMAATMLFSQSSIVSLASELGAVESEPENGYEESLPEDVIDDEAGEEGFIEEENSDLENNSSDETEEESVNTEENEEETSFTYENSEETSVIDENSDEEEDSSITDENDEEETEAIDEDSEEEEESLISEEDSDVAEDESFQETEEINTGDLDEYAEIIKLINGKAAPSFSILEDETFQEDQVYVRIVTPTYVKNISKDTLWQYDCELRYEYTLVHKETQTVRTGYVPVTFENLQDSSLNINLNRNIYTFHLTMSVSLYDKVNNRVLATSKTSDIKSFKTKNHYETKLEIVPVIEKDSERYSYQDGNPIGPIDLGSIKWNNARYRVTSQSGDTRPSYDTRVISSVVVKYNGKPVTDGSLEATVKRRSGEDRVFLSITHGVNVKKTGTYTITVTAEKDPSVSKAASASITYTIKKDVVPDFISVRTSSPRYYKPVNRVITIKPTYECLDFQMKPIKPLKKAFSLVNSNYESISPENITINPNTGVITVGKDFTGEVTLRIKSVTTALCGKDYTRYSSFIIISSEKLEPDYIEISDYFGNVISDRKFTTDQIFGLQVDVIDKNGEKMNMDFFNIKISGQSIKRSEYGPIYSYWPTGKFGKSTITLTPKDGSGGKQQVTLNVVSYRDLELFDSTKSGPESKIDGEYDITSELLQYGHISFSVRTSTGESVVNKLTTITDKLTKCTVKAKTGKLVEVHSSNSILDYYYIPKSASDTITLINAQGDKKVYKLTNQLFNGTKPSLVSNTINCYSTCRLDTVLTMSLKNTNGKYDEYNYRLLPAFDTNGVNVKYEYNNKVKITPYEYVKHMFNETGTVSGDSIPIIQNAFELGLNTGSYKYYLVLYKQTESGLVATTPVLVTFKASKVPEPKITIPTSYTIDAESGKGAKINVVVTNSYDKVVNLSKVYKGEEYKFYYYFDIVNDTDGPMLVLTEHGQMAYKNGQLTAKDCEGVIQCVTMDLAGENKYSQVNVKVTVK